MGGENGKRKTSYERYFEGYSQRPVLDKAGNVRMIPVYTAPYWMLDAEDGAWIGRKILVVLLTLGQMGLYLTVSLLRIGSNHSGLVIIPSGLSAACLLFVVTAAIRYAAAKRKMTVCDYRTARDSLRRWNFGSGVLLVLTAVGTLGALAASGGQETALTLLSAFGYALAGGIGFLQCRLEERCFYRETENEKAYQ